jgi:Flp pilus assembly protein TadD
MRTPAPGFRASPPVQALMKQAEAQQAAGDLAGAGTVLERALRIEPRNPYLWNRLARVRLEQGQYPQAGILAAKSSTLAGDLPELQRDNRRIAAAARRGNGR